MYMFPEGTPKPPDPREAMIKAGQQEDVYNGNRNPEFDQMSPLGLTLHFVEAGGIPDRLASVESRELVDDMQEETIRSLIEPSVRFARLARTGFVTQDWPMGSERVQALSMASLIKTKSSIKRPYRPEKGENDAEKEIIKNKKYIHEVYQSKVFEEAERIAAFSEIIADGHGPMGVYSEGRSMLGLNQRRLAVTSTDTLRKAFGKRHDKVLNQYKAAVNKEKLHELVQSKLKADETKEPLPDEVQKMLIENAPQFFKEGFTDLVKDDAARMHDLANVISEMNKRDPFNVDGKEMKISADKLTVTEQEIIGSLFQKIERVDEHGNTVDLKNDKTRKIKIFFDEQGNVVPLNKDGDPIDASLIDDKRTKEFYINILSYENTVSSEVEHKRFIALMMAYTMLGGREKIQELVKSSPNVKLDLTDDEKSKLGLKETEELKRATDLRDTINILANDLLEDWDSPRVEQEREAAACAFELNFMLQCATLQIANLGHRYHWDLEEIKDKDGKATGGFRYKFLDEIGDPDMALDAMTAMFTMQHEYTYAAIKNRASTPLLPPVDPKYAEKIINFVVQGGRDPEAMKYAETDEYIARFYGIVGLFAKDLANNVHWQEGAAIREKQKRSDGVQRECSEEFIQCLEQTIFGIPTIYGDKVFPMPITPFFNLTLFDSMHVSKDKTVQDKLNDRELLTQIDFEQQHPFMGDGRMVSGKFVTDMTYIMYGGADVKGLGQFFSNPFEAIRRIVKSLDIGARGSVRLIDFVENKGTKNEKTTKLPINKKFHEITYSVYMSMAYLTFIKFAMFDGNKRWENGRGRFQDHHDEKTDENINYADFLEVFGYQLPTKQGYEHYGDAMYLLFMGLREVIEGITKETDDYYEHKVKPVFQNDNQDPLSQKRNHLYKTTDKYKKK